MSDLAQSGVAYNVINLPSRGALYDGKLPGGKVEIRKMTVAEEVILQSTSAGADLVGKLVAACCKLPMGFLPTQLLLSDRIAILIALRAFTFGPRYQIPYSCTSCGAVNKADVNLGEDIKEKVGSDKIVEPIEIPLTDAKKIISMRFLRGSDEAAIVRTRKKDAPQDDVVVRMALQIVKVDGEELPSLDARIAFVRDLTIPDAMDIREALAKVESGLDTSIAPVCSACGEVNELQMPMTSEFFRPARSRA